jgi:hypothetical protein
VISSALSTTGSFFGSLALTVDVRPRHAQAGQVDLVGADLFRPKLIGRSIEKAAELRHRVHIGFLGCWREIANRHVVDQPPTQRGHLGHHRVSCLTIGFGHRNPLRQELPQPPLTPLVAERVRCVPGMLNSSEVKVLYPT